ncbi:sugar ABC transporter permease [Anaerolineales bacterium HSG6]|nr:sugar ABC transporter permease [Anaerolineales bacterium HSG6]MDM8532084.1 sugar ABC transporter permease [Anaerolineales bacterium HSG25]
MTQRQKNRFLSTIEGYLYLAPTMIVLAIFVFLPVISSFSLSLNRQAPFGNKQRYVGSENYSKLLGEFAECFTAEVCGDYGYSLYVTIIFTLGTVPAGLALAVLLAVALSYPLRAMSPIHRMLIFVPVVISSAVAGVLFRWLYHPVVGYLNYWMTFVGLDGPDWLTTKRWALVAVILVSIWKNLGFNTIIALAGVQNIDNSYYDAAKVDGANVWQRFYNITLPLLSPTLFFLLIINIITSFQTFGEIDILTEGGPGKATTTLVYSIFDHAFKGTPQRGIASSEAYLLALMVIVMSFAQMWVLGRKVHYQ